jgi:hypothetical protein
LKKENNLSSLNIFGKTAKSIFRGFRSGTSDDFESLMQTEMYSPNQYNCFQAS